MVCLKQVKMMCLNHNFNSRVVELMYNQLIKELKATFYEELDGQSTGIIYGSAAIGDWVSARSDLDVIVLIESMALIDKVSTQFKKWKSSHSHELLDGFLLIKDGSHLTAKSFYNFDSSPKSLSEAILTPDIWKIKNESKVLFGSANIKSMVRSVDSVEMRKWAKENKKQFWIPSIKNSIAQISLLPQDKLLPLNPAIWIASGAARIKTLEMTGSCMSKQDALSWLIKKGEGPVDLIKMLLENYKISDSAAPKMSKVDAGLIAKHALSIIEE